MKWIKKINESFDRLIHKSYTLDKEALALYRICFSLYFLLFGFPIYRWISQNPDMFFDPPLYSIASFFSGFPPTEFFIAIDIILIVLLIALLFGYRTVTTSILLALFWLIGSSFRFSFSKIDHNIFLILTPLILSISGWGEKYSIDPRVGMERKREGDPSKAGLPVFLIVLFLGFGYFTSGYAKFFTWMDFDITTHGVRSWVTSAIFVSGQEGLLLPSMINITNPYFWEALDILAVIFELGFFFAVFHKQTFKIFLCIGVLFHFSNMLILYIPFRNMMIIYLLFIDWKAVKQVAVRYSIGKYFTVKNMSIAISFYLVLYILTGLYGESILFSLSVLELSLSPLMSDPSFWLTHVVMGAAVIIVGIWIFRRMVLKITKADPRRNR